jgi:hypothetical protein
VSSRSVCGMPERRLGHTSGGVWSLGLCLFVRVGPADAPASVVRAFKGRTGSAKVLGHLWDAVSAS